MSADVRGKEQDEDEDGAEGKRERYKSDGTNEAIVSLIHDQTLIQ